MYERSKGIQIPHGARRQRAGINRSCSVFFKHSWLESSILAVNDRKLWTNPTSMWLLMSPLPLHPKQYLYQPLQVESSYQSLNSGSPNAALKRWIMDTPLVGTKILIDKCSCGHTQSQKIDVFTTIYAMRDISCTHAGVLLDSIIHIIIQYYPIISIYFFKITYLTLTIHISFIHFIILFMFQCENSATTIFTNDAPVLPGSAAESLCAARQSAAGHRRHRTPSSCDRVWGVEHDGGVKEW